jgi:Uma2 family endonuclease
MSGALWKGAPELVIEIAASNLSYNLHEKFQVYERCGVQEYLVWRTRDREIDWFVLRDGGYAKQDVPGDGILRSGVFPGLWLDPVALLAGDLQRVFQVVQMGVATPEHAGFVSGTSR